MPTKPWKNVHNCKLCPYFTTSFFCMENHTKRHRFPVETFICTNSEIEFYHCTVCDFKTELTILFKQHIAKYHDLKTEFSEDFHIQNYVCEKCNFETNFSLKWFQHVSTCKDKIVLEAHNSEVYTCEKCPFKTTVKNGLKRHTGAVHLKEDIAKQYKCKECEFNVGSSCDFSSNSPTWCCMGKIRTETI